MVPPDGLGLYQGEMRDLTDDKCKRPYEYRLSNGSVIHVFMRPLQLASSPSASKNNPPLLASGSSAFRSMPPMLPVTHQLSGICHSCHHEVHQVPIN